METQNIVEESMNELNNQYQMSLDYTQFPSNFNLVRRILEKKHGKKITKDN